MIARNLCRDAHRRPLHQNLPEDHDLPDHAADQERSEHARQEWRRVVRDLSTLAEVDRSILLMRALKDMDYRAIGEAVGLQRGRCESETPPSSRPLERGPAQQGAPLMTIARSVIVDLWPAYASGEASQDTRALVDAFLRDDPELARQLREDPLGTLEAPMPSPDLEMRALTKARRRLGGFRSLLFMAMLFSCMAFGRIVSDTSFNVSPRPVHHRRATYRGGVLGLRSSSSLIQMRGRILVGPKAPTTRGWSEASSCGSTVLPRPTATSASRRRGGPSVRSSLGD